MFCPCCLSAFIIYYVFLQLCLPDFFSGPCKNVSWLLGSDGDVHVCIIGESDDLKSPKFILSELRNKTTDNLNNINR